MHPLKLKLFVLLLVSGLVLAGCALGPPVSCGDTIGGTADTVKFDQYFTRMALVNQDGVTGPEGAENGIQFTAADMLDIRADTKSEVSVRVCVQSRSGGPIAFDQTQTIAQGSGGLSLGAFDPGTYVVRVIVEDVLVKNFPFEIK